ncbi:Ditrans,polycis-undecaprenyl-diphosphate synthase ((2E,6E)-farnesyl-diphosphate specific) [subsurface metagenome]
MVKPEHVAVIPDGNRRWAKLHGLPALEGHRRGAEAMHNTIDYLIGRVKYLTLWGFSTDNWKRTSDEIGALFRLLALWIGKDAPWLNQHGVKLRHIGRIDELPDFLQQAINQAVELTTNNSDMTLILAFNYSGRAEIVDAIRRLINGGRPFEPAISRSELDEELFSRYLYTGGMPDVDLVIRTAGEFRLSNFLLWQTAYSEFYFTPVLWPDFNEKELEKALQVYSERRRRFGGD